MMCADRRSQPSLHQGGERSHPRPRFWPNFVEGAEPWYPLLLIVATLGIFWPSVFMEFTYDDPAVILSNPNIRGGDIGRIWFWEGQLIWARQVRALSYMADYALFGFSPMGYHLHSLLWHVLCVILVYVLAKKLTHHATFSFLGALIFAIHPIHVEAVTNISNRKELLSLAFLLLAFVCYMQFLESQSIRKWPWLLIGGFSWLLGLLSKEVTIVLGPLLLAYEYLLVPKPQRFLTKYPILLWSLAGVGSFFLFLYAFLIVDISNLKTSKYLLVFLKGYDGELTYLSLVATSARAFWTYVQLLIWPAGLCPDHVVDLSPSFLDVSALFAWAGLIAFVFVSVLVGPRWPILAFGMLWFFITFVPVSNWIPVSYILADRYGYTPSVGFCIVVVTLSQALYGWLVTRQPRWAFGTVTLLAAGLTVGYATTTLAYNANWSNQKTIWSYALRCNPESFRAYAHLGDLYLQDGLNDKALEYYSRAIELGYVDGYVRRGNVYFEMGQFDGALNEYNYLLVLKPDWAPPYNNRGNVFYELGNYEAALKEYHRAIALMPDWAAPYTNRGIVYLAQGKYNLALQDFTKALERFKNNSRALNLRGLAYEKLGQRGKAQKDYGNAIASDPSNGEAYFNLGRIQLQNDELDAAILSYQKAKELGWAKAEDVLTVLRKKGYLEYPNE